MQSDLKSMPRMLCVQRTLGASVVWLCICMSVLYFFTSLFVCE